MIPLALLAAVSCVQVEGDRILMSDLAKAIPEFSAAAGTEPIGLAPAPRVRRTFFWREIEQIGKAHGIQVRPGAAPARGGLKFLPCGLGCATRCQAVIARQKTLS